jgi:hypothetical protein
MALAARNGAPMALSAYDTGPGRTGGRPAQWTTTGQILNSLTGIVTLTAGRRHTVFRRGKGPPWRGDRRPKGTPLMMGFRLASVKHGGHERDAGCGDGREDPAGVWRQWGNGHNRFKELRRRGVSVFRAAVAAGSPTGFWRMSGHPAVQAALRNHHFDSLGLPRLYVPYPA